jgi:putative pyruvate formate lyase activating enzyme
MSVEDLSSAMLRLQDRGAHNINFVTPSPWIPQIIRAVSSSARQGLEIPLVYNTSGYDSLEALNLLDGICDVYLSDYRYHDPRMALRYSQAFDYPQVAKQALREMYRQVGDLEVSAEGVARRGLIVRHLVLPQGISSTVEVLRFLPHLLSPDIHISLMNQYFPAFRASDYPELRHPLSHQEYDRALKILEEVGMINGWVQESYNVSENVLGESCP